MNSMIKMRKKIILRSITFKLVNIVKKNLKKETPSNIKRIVNLNLSLVNIVKYLTIIKKQNFGIMSNIVEVKL